MQLGGSKTDGLSDVVIIFPRKASLGLRARIAVFSCQTNTTIETWCLTMYCFQHTKQQGGKISHKNTAEHEYFIMDTLF